MHHLHPWWFHWLGGDGGSIYDYMSAPIPDLAYLGLLGAAYHVIKRHRCGEPRCWRIGHRKVPGTEHYACHKHHPEPKPAKGHMHRDYHAAREAAAHKLDSESHEA